MQGLIVIICVAAAVAFMGRKFYRTVRNRGCACACDKEESRMKCECCQQNSRGDMEELKTK